MESKTQWVVFDKKGKKVKTVTLTHPTGHLYRQIEPFEADLLSKGLSAHKKESLEQEHLKGKSFKEKLICLGWPF